MNKARLVLLFALLSCGSDEVNPPGAPNWVADYPKAAVGAKTADLIFEADKAATIYWVVSTQALSLTSPDDLVTEAGSPTQASIILNGSVDAGANAEVKQELEDLAENTKYFVYSIAENSADQVLQSSVSASEFTTKVRQEVKTFSSSAESRTVSYLIYQPEEVLKYPDEAYPILFFLGGNGEIAAQGQINMIRNGSLPEYINKGNDVPMIVMSIQHTVANWNVAMIHEGVTHGLATYPVDPARVYMTGISGGGFGCWNYSVDHADVLAAIVPISGGGNQGKACNLNSVAISAFHNQTDGIVGSANSVNMVNAVNNCTRPEAATLLLFPDTGHDCWRRVYDQNHGDWSKSPGVSKFDIYAWLLSKKKS